MSDYDDSPAPLYGMYALRCPCGAWCVVVVAPLEGPGARALLGSSADATGSLAAVGRFVLEHREHNQYPRSTGGRRGFLAHLEIESEGT